MRWAIGLLLGVAACGGSAAREAPPQVAPVLVAPAPVAPVQVAPVKPDGARALVHAGAALRWHRGTREHTAVAAERAEVVVTAQDGADVQVRFDDDDVELALWTDVALLAPAIVRVTAVQVGGVAGPELRPGAPVTVVERRGDTARVRYQEMNLVIEGDVDASAIGHRYDRAPRPGLDGEYVSLCQRMDVRSAPGGAVLATVTEADPSCSMADVRRAGPPADGWQPIVIQTEHANLRGVVRTEDIATDVVMGFVASDLEGPAGGLALERGACLYDRPGGAVVGATRRARRWKARAAEGGWHRLTVALPELTVEVAARPGAPPCPISDR